MKMLALGSYGFIQALDLSKGKKSGNLLPSRGSGNPVSLLGRPWAVGLSGRVMVEAKEEGN